MDKAFTKSGRFPRLKQDVLLFVILGVLGLASVIGLIAYKQGLWQERERFLLSTPDASGISIGMPVKFLGFRVGKVDDMRLHYPQILVELTINREHLTTIPQGSTARLAREGFIGSSYIEILPNPKGAGRSIAAGDALAFDRGMSLSELSSYFDTEVHPVIMGLQDTVTWINDPHSDFRQSFTTLHQVVANLQQTQQRLDKMLDDMTLTSASMRQSVAVASADVSAMARGVDKTVGEEVPRLRQSVEQTLKETEKTLRVFQQLSAKADQTVDSAQPLVEEASEITSGVKRSWPMKMLLDQPKTEVAPGNLYDLPLPPLDSR